jgi:hypothetical protein
MKIKIPDSYELPEGTQDGDIIEEITSYRVEGEYFVPTMLAGSEIEAEEAEDEMEDDMEEEAVAEMEEAPMRGLGARVMGMA